MSPVEEMSPVYEMLPSAMACLHLNNISDCVFNHVKI